jgi:hypothetical protein
MKVKKEVKRYGHKKEWQNRAFQQGKNCQGLYGSWRYTEGCEKDRR